MASALLRERSAFATAVSVAALLLFVGLAAFLYFLCWNGVAAGFLSDDAIYLLMADSFRGARTGLSQGLIDYVMRQSLFPPLYPLLLAAFGADSSELLRAHLVTTTTLIAGLAMYAIWVESQIRDRVGAIGLALVFALLPGTLIHSLDIYSEFPYLFLTLVACWLAGRTPGAARVSVVLGVCVGLAVATRSAGLSLALALGIWLLRQRGSRILCFVLALAPALLWSAYKQWAYGNHEGYGALWSALWLQFVQHPGYVWTYLQPQFGTLWQGVLANFDLWQSRTTACVVAAVLLAAMVSWIRRLVAWRFDAWYVLIGAAMIIVYPYPGTFPRLVLPLLPIVLFYAYAEIRVGLGRAVEIGGKPIVAYGLLAIMLTIVAPSLFFLSDRMLEPSAPLPADWKHTRYWLRPWRIDDVRKDVAFRANLVEALREVGQSVPEQDCVSSPHTAIGMLYARRVFVQPPAPSVDAREFDRRIRGCAYVLLVPVKGEIGKDIAEPFYPRERLATDSFETARIWEDTADPNVPTAILLRLKTSAAQAVSLPGAHQ